MTQKDLNTEEKIFEAAKEVFTVKGYAAARMQEIADKAGINKALLHYYYRSKSKLFQKIFQKVFATFLLNITSIFTENLPLDDLIRKFVDVYLTQISKNPQVPNFIINELHQNSAEVFDMFDTMPIRKNIMHLQARIDKEIEAGTLVPMNAMDLIINLLSMTLFPIIVKPLLSYNFQLDQEKFNELIERRKKSIPEFVIRSIRP